MAHYSQKWWYPNDSGTPAANQRAIVFTDINVLATIYSDAGMTTPIANPTVTNSIGVLDFYVPDASGTYFIFVGPTAVGDSQQWNSGGSLDSPVLTINNVPPDLAGNSTVTPGGIGAIASAIVDVKGDIIAASGPDTPVRVGVGSNGTVLTADSSATGGVSWQTNSGGDVTGPGSSTANALSRFSGTSGKIIKNSPVTLSDTGTLNIPSQVTPPAYADGNFYYDAGDRTLIFNNDDTNVRLPLGTQVRFLAHNENGFTIPRGSAVRIVGVHSSGPEIIDVDFSIANDGVATESVGVTMEDIGPDSDGFVLVEGLLRNIDTSTPGFFEGQYVFLSDTVEGALVSNPPHQPSYRNVVGIIAKIGLTDGSIYVFPSLARNGYGGTNQYLALDTAGNNQIYRSLLGTAGRLTVTHSPTAATFDIDATLSGSFITKATLAAKGSLVSATGSATPVNVGVGSDNQVLTADSAQASGLKWSNNGTGDVIGPGSAVDNSLPRFDGTTGKLIQGSLVNVADDGTITLPGTAGPPTYANGQLYYDTSFHFPSFTNDDSNFLLKIGMQTYIRVSNNSGSTIGVGAPVRITGDTGVFPYPPTIDLAGNTSEVLSHAVGLAAENILNGQEGHVLIEGLLYGFPTVSFNVGDYLYVNPLGGLINTRPVDPAFACCIGMVTVDSIGHGTISVFRTASALGFGTANQVRGVNAAGNAEENKTLQGTVGRLDVTNGVGTVTFDISNTVLNTKTDKATLTAKGSIYAATGAGIPADFPVGTDTQVIRANSATGSGLEWHTLVPADIPGAVPSTRLITTSNGVTGGGDLSADRNIQPVYGTTAGTVAQGNDSRIVNSVQNTRLITTSNGVTGGGDLSADRNIQPVYGTSAGTVMQGNDSRVANAVPNTRLITTSNGVTGGGDLTADRNIQPVYGTTAGTVMQGNDSRVVNSVPNTRLITTSNGVTGGGDLSADRNIQPVYGTTSGTITQGNDARVTGAQQRADLTAKGDLYAATASATTTRLPIGTDNQFLRSQSATGTGLRWDTITATDVGAVPTTRLITTSNGITGGGPLSSDLTLQPVYGTTAGTVTQGNDSRVVNAVPNTRTITAGTGLTGGGDLSANRTISAVFGTTSGTITEGNDTRVTGAQQRSTLTAKGDIYVATSSATTIKLGSGVDNQFLRSQSAALTGLRWDTITATDVGAAPSTRLINTTSGLTGGGDLSADRTIQPVYGTTAASVMEGNDTRVVNAVQGPASSTDTAIALYNGTSGKLVKDSNVLISSTGVIAMPTVASVPISANRLLSTGNKLVFTFNDGAFSDVSLGQQIYMRVNNNTGGDINGGTPVYITGNLGSPSFTPTIATASSNALNTAKVVGATTAKINDTLDGYIACRGLTNFNTTGMTINDTVYLSGATLATTPPSTSHYTSRVGTVASVGSGANGIININPQLPTLDSSVAINPCNLGAQPVGGIAIARNTGAIAANTMFLMPIMTMRTAPLSNFQFEVTTLSVLAVARGGLYAASIVGRPSGSPLFDFGTIAADTVGVKTFSPGGVTLVEGVLYFFALVAQTAPSTIRLINGGFNAYVPAAGGHPGNNPFPTAFTQTGVSGALPAIGTLATGNAPFTTVTFT